MFDQLLWKFMDSMHQLSELWLRQYVPLSWENVLLEQQIYRKKGMLCNLADNSALILPDFAFFSLMNFWKDNMTNNV